MVVLGNLIQDFLLLGILGGGVQLFVQGYGES